MLCVFFFNDTATTEIYTLSLHDALPIYVLFCSPHPRVEPSYRPESPGGAMTTMQIRNTVRDFEQWKESFDKFERFRADRKSTRLNSSHANISYAVFCLKKKNKPIHRSVR